MYFQGVWLNEDNDMFNHYSDCNRHGGVDSQVKFLYKKVEKNNS